MLTHANSLSISLALPLSLQTQRVTSPVIHLAKHSTISASGISRCSSTFHTTSTGYLPLAFHSWSSESARITSSAIALSIFLGGGKVALVCVPIALVSAACHFRKADLRHANKSMQMRTCEILCSCATSWGMQIKLTVLTILTMLNIP